MTCSGSMVNLRQQGSVAAIQLHAVRKGKLDMGGRKRVLILGFLGFIILVGGVMAFFVLPMLIALGVAVLALIIVPLMMAGPSQRRWDAVSKAEADAAQRGDGAIFLGDRHDHIF